MFHGCRTKLSFAKLSWLDSSLAWPKSIAQVISVEKFGGIDQSAKSMKLFHLKQFAIHGKLLTQTR